MSGGNAVELRIIEWLKMERGRGSRVWPALRETAQGPQGAARLGDRLSSLLDGSALAQIHLHELRADQERARAAARELRGDGEPLAWLDELDPEVIRVFLSGVNGDALYVHARVRPFHPNNRYRVDDEHTVFEVGWTAGAGAWGLAARERQVCPESIRQPCACRIRQAER